MPLVKPLWRLWRIFVFLGNWTAFNLALDRDRFRGVYTLPVGPVVAFR